MLIAKILAHICLMFFCWLAAVVALTVLLGSSMTADSDKKATYEISAYGVVGVLIGVSLIQWWVPLLP